MADVNTEQPTEGNQNNHKNHNSVMNGHGSNRNFFDEIAKTGATSDCEKLKECFDHFDADG